MLGGGNTLPRIHCPLIPHPLCGGNPYTIAHSFSYPCILACSHSSRIDVLYTRPRILDGWAGTAIDSEKYITHLIHGSSRPRTCALVTTACATDAASVNLHALLPITRDAAECIRQVTRGSARPAAAARGLVVRHRKEKGRLLLCRRKDGRTTDRQATDRRS